MIPRIDPRSLQGRIGPSGLRRSSRLLSEAVSSSTRFDPHLEARARIRRELRNGRMLGTTVAAAAVKPVRTVSDDLPMTLVVSLVQEPWAGGEADLLGTAREMFPDHAVALLSFGSPHCLPQAAGADRLLSAAGGSEAQQLSTLAAIIERYGPDRIVFAEGDMSGDLARRLAARTGRSAAFNVVHVKPRSVICNVEGGGRETTMAAPDIIVLKRAACAALDTDELFEARVLEFLGRDFEGDAFEDRGILPASAKDLPLTEADLVVCAGAGVKDWDTFFAVAEGISAAVAGSRVVCDAGFLPRTRQVGASGQIIESKCYVAFGVSGAPQHLQGIQACRHVIAVNTDPHAPIMARADLAIVGDVQEVLKAFRELVGVERAR
jgi:electron transfer flavoprotein alpha subunit